MELLAKYGYALYGKYITRWRALPLDIDMLRPVERRTLLAVYELAKDKFIKSAKVVGYAIGTYHPHGEASLYSTLVRYVRTGLVDGQGGFFSYGLTDSQPSAMRYTEVRANKDIVKLMSLVKFAPWDTPEFEYEPLYIPAPIPLGLIGNEINHGVGFHKTTYPSFRIKDLMRRLLFLLGKKRRANIMPNLLGCHVVNVEKVKELLENGKATIIFEADYKKEKDGYHIYGCPTSWAPLKKYAERNKIELLDLSTDGHHIVAVTKKDDILDAIKGSVSFDIKVVKLEDELVVTQSVDEAIRKSFSAYKDAVETKLKQDAQSIEAQIKEMTILKKLKPYIKQANSISELAKLSKLPEADIKPILTNYSVSKLVGVKIDLETLEEKLKLTNSRLNRIWDYSVALVEEISKEYL